MGAAASRCQMGDPRGGHGQRLRRIQLLGIVGQQKGSHIPNHGHARRSLLRQCGFQFRRQILQGFGQNRPGARVNNVVRGQRPRGQ